MNSILEKTYNRSRSLLFGLLQSCLLEGNALDTCPLAQLRLNMSYEEKYHYTMALSDKEIDEILVQHEECFHNRIKDSGPQ